MRLLYLHQYFASPDSVGGTRSYEMARRLAASGHEVTVITSSAGLGNRWAPSVGWHSHALDGIRLEVLRLPYRNAMSFGRRIWAFFRFAFAAAVHTRRFGCDAVFATSTPLTIVLPGLIAKFWHRVPLVFEVRDLWPELPLAVGALRNPLAKLSAQGLEWLAYHMSDHVVALSPGMADGVLRRGVSSSKVTVIPNSCDVALFRVPPGTGDWVRTRLGLAESQPLVVYAGTFGMINGVDYLVDVAAAVRGLAPDVHFLLVGDGGELESVRAKATAAGVLGETLTIWRPVSKNQMPDLLSAATVATSIFIPLEAMWHNSANKFFDALAAGRPVAINYGGWQAEVINDSGAGIVMPPGDPLGAAEELVRFLYDPERLARAAAAAERLADEVFSRDRLYSRLEQVLRYAVAGG